MREVKQEPLAPPQKRARTDEDAERTTRAPPPDLKIDFKDTTAKERIITVTHTTASDEASFTVNTASANGLSVNCGGLHIRVTDGTTLETEVSTVVSNDARAKRPLSPVTPSTVRPPPRHSAPTQPVERPSSEPRRSPSMVSNATTTSCDKGRMVTVVFVDTWHRRTTMKATRDTRVHELLRKYATELSLRYESLIFDCIGNDRPVELHNRLGTVVERHSNFLMFEVQNLDDKEEYKGYSDDSDS